MKAENCNQMKLVLQTAILFSSIIKTLKKTTIKEMETITKFDVEETIYISTFLRWKKYRK